MKKNELLNGDIVVEKHGELAVVIADAAGGYLLYQSGGSDDLDYYSDDLEDSMGDGGDIMQVYRPNGGMGFACIDDEDPIYERDDTWVRPSEEEMEKARAETRAKHEAQMAEWAAQAAERRKHQLAIITQAFYGNRTATVIDRDSMDAFILGWQGEILLKDERIDRTIIRLADSEHVVLIYNKYQEAEQLKNNARYLEKDGYAAKPLAEIPELNIKIYSRCIVCRMDANGCLASIEDEDYEIWGRYLAR